MFCRPLGQNFTIHYVWPWLKAFTGSLSLTFSCQMYYLKVLQNFIESGQESKNGNRNRPLQSATLHRFWWDQGGFCGKMQQLQLCHHFGARDKIVPHVGPRPALPLRPQDSPCCWGGGSKRRVNGGKAALASGWYHIMSQAWFPGSLDSW